MVEVPWTLKHGLPCKYRGTTRLPVSFLPSPQRLWSRVACRRFSRGVKISMGRQPRTHTTQISQLRGHLDPPLGATCSQNTQSIVSEVRAGSFKDVHDNLMIRFYSRTVITSARGFVSHTGAQRSSSHGEKVAGNGMSPSCADI
jgi:hypothetical protein